MRLGSGAGFRYVHCLRLLADLQNQIYGMVWPPAASAAAGQVIKTDRIGLDPVMPGSRRLRDKAGAVRHCLRLCAGIYIYNLTLAIDNWGIARIPDCS